MNMLDKMLVSLFMVVLKTKRIANSAVNGKLNHSARKVFPYVLGIMIAIWATFVFVF